MVRLLLILFSISCASATTEAACRWSSQVQQCFGLKHKETASTATACQSECCADDACQIWQYDGPGYPNQCWMGPATSCGGSKNWTQGGSKINPPIQAGIDFGKPDLSFMGIGGLSGGGGTSRLLFDYPEPQRSDILDALFSPQKGASVQILKVEIGGDAQSTEAVEASHMHDADDGALDCEICYNRGYEWWLLKEAKQRNPDIKTYGLSWGVPGWIGNGSFYSQDNIDYHLRWMLGLKKYHGIQLDYMGIWNERTYNRDWVVNLRHALDTEESGIGKHVQIVAADTNWNICDDMASNKTLRDAVSIVGVHYPITNALSSDLGSQSGNPAPTSCLNLGKPLWTSEGWNLDKRNDWAGAMNLATTLNKNWILSRQQAMIIWTVIYSWYSILPFSNPDGVTVGGMGHGLMSACEPWSGHYRVMPPVYAVAHHTQFARADGSCSYIANAAVALNGTLGASTIVAYRCSVGTDVEISIVIESSAAITPQAVRLQMRNIPKDIVRLHQWQTNETHWFLQGADLSISSDGSVGLVIAPSSIITLSSRTGQGRVAQKNIPASKVFPLPYSDNFDAYADQATVKYFTDEGGSWNAAPSPGRKGMCLKQVVTRYPIAWEKNPDPFSVLGDSQSTDWGNYTVSVDALEGNATTPSAPQFTKLCGRIHNYARNGAPVHGYCIVHSDHDKTWKLLVSGTTLKQGTLSSVGGWHTLSLQFQGTLITASIDGIALATVHDTTFPVGMAAVGSGWHEAWFDNFAIQPAAGHAMTII